MPKIIPCILKDSNTFCILLSGKTCFTYLHHPSQDPPPRCLLKYIFAKSSTFTTVGQYTETYVLGKKKRNYNLKAH